MGFADDQYIEEYKKHHKYPKIHDDIYSMHTHVDCKNIMDLGCCTGLLATHLAETYHTVVGIEPNKNYLKKAPHTQDVKYYNFPITPKTLGLLEKVIRKHNIDTIFGRRVMPEIYNYGGDKLIKSLNKMFYRNNIQNLILEGRIESRNSTHDLSNINKEIKYFTDYEITYTHKNCAILKRK